jgi:hypothetical protein
MLTSSQSRSFTSPRAFLLSIRSKVPHHALLVCSWGKEGGAILSVPTREYFQSSAFVPDPAEDRDGDVTLSSVRSSSAGMSWGHAGRSESEDTSREYWDEERKRQWALGIGSPTTTGPEGEEEEEIDEAASDDAFFGGGCLL